MISGVYLILSPSNKPYVGESVNIKRRWNRYFNNLAKGQHKLYNSFKKYGINNHNFLVLELCEIELLKERERYWQDFFCSMTLGLNCKLTKTTEKKVIYDDYTKYKMGSAFRGKKISKEHKDKISKSHKNKVVSEETKLKMSESHKGKMADFGNPNHIKVKVINTINNEIYIGTKTMVMKKFCINYTTLQSKCKYYNNGRERKLKEYEFFFLDNMTKEFKTF